MKNVVYDRMLRRELGDGSRYASVRGIYGDRKWIKDMDIVNELDGHTGCVNALSWSRSGRLLASGSDDHRINIHSYHPDSSTSQFSLTTSILTGHMSNIFSVKFMPYTNDRTIVSATDDVRIFDIEHSGHSALGSSATSRPRARPIGIHGIIDSVTLTEGDTNAKAFRCHSDTVKRIVTENTPFYFLTCSEDGDVRQWDIRQPSKTYPPSRDGARLRWARSPEATDNVPPPLISYKRYNLDLNTVSCSPSQPHYIALGGAHLHCFLHDRRMLGRDKLREKGAHLNGASNWSDHEDELLGKATQCVRRFAPNGKNRMTRGDNGHITACKISDANPNELIVSWSGDWIYSFDMLQSPDPSEETEQSQYTKGTTKNRVKDQVRKRKRTKSSVTLSEEGVERAGSRQRTESSRASASDSHEGLALRVQYQNGQSEDIPIEPSSPSDGILSESEEAVLSQADHFRIAKTTINLQKKMLELNGRDSASRVPQFTTVIGFAASILPEMDEIARSWRYPVNPSQVDVALQNRLRADRCASRRFVQAAGTLARVLGGQLHTGGNGSALVAQYFSTIQPAFNERDVPRHEQFGYDFLKAILLWLDSGLGAVVEGFSSASPNPRRPLALDADVDSIHDELIPYLLHKASDKPVVNVDVSRFESDDTRLLFNTEKDAVLAFARALRTPFADLTGAMIPASGATGEHHAVQDRTAAIEQWACKVGRGLLLNASKNITFASVDRSHGGLGRPDAVTRADEEALREQQEDVDPVEDDDLVVEAELVGRALLGPDTGSPSGSGSAAEDNRLSIDLTGDVGEEEVVESDGDIDPNELDDNDDNDDDDDDDDEDSEDSDDPDRPRTRRQRMFWRSDYDRSAMRENVEADIPCAPHMRKYVGHCNVRTVKDVNFFGLDDEYVVSGSDCGHVFIWDRKTSQLVNILKGDGETVNVVQGHPYEPTMAVSGIDHSIKIFSPDARAQYNARKGIGVQSVDSSNFSSIHFSRRRSRWGAASEEPAIPRDPFQEYSDEEGEDEVGADGLSSRKRMHDEYRITSQNDNDRRGGNQDAFITRALLAQLAQRIHMQHATMGDEPGEGGGPVYLNEDNCAVM